MLEQSARASLARDGYFVISGLVPDALLKAARDTICAFVNADLARPETWYLHEPLDWSIVPVHHAQAFWNIRQLPRVHELFANLWSTEKLWVSMDRGVFKVPLTEEQPGHVDQSILHWDLDPRETGSGRYQGMLFLTDVSSGEGTFECVPSIFQELEQYLYRHSGPVLDAPVDVTGHDVVEVPVRTGDFVIWNSRLPHHGGRNRGERPRISMALTMYPEGSDKDRAERVECWRQKRAPVWWRGCKGQLDPEPGLPAELTPLGRRLVGIDHWP